MKYLQNYYHAILKNGNSELANSVLNTAENIGNQYIRNFTFSSHETGLLFGNVQSGKTGQMFGIICKATDLGFPVFLLLTTDNVILQQQTLDRVRSDLDGYCICGENDAGLFIENNLVLPTIVVLKKNSRILKLWANIFNSTGFMKGNPLFIIDDEADAASLNTMVNQNKKSTINKYLESIKNGATSSLYLQVTGTPQALLLQTVLSGWQPYFVHYFQPGNNYLGGDFFFPTNKKADCIEILDYIDNPIQSVVIRHLLVSAQILASGGEVANCLIHPSVRQAIHQYFFDDIVKELNWCIANFDTEFSSKLQYEYKLISPIKTEKLPFELLKETISDLLTNDKVKVLVMNGKSEVESDEYGAGSNIIIGGNTLGRGVTFPKLHTIYYARTSKKPQADTIWQHSRMFGYDRDPGLTKIYIDEHLYKLFTDINATNNSIISQIERGIQNIKIYYPTGINPTRKNVLDNKRVEILTGGTNYYPFDPGNYSIDAISDLLSPFSESEPYYQVSLRLIKEVLSHIIPSSDFKLSVIQSVIDTFLSEKPTEQGILIVRRNRNVSQGTGALLSPNDWSLGGSFENKLVLTIYQVTGKGWSDKGLWVPNIKLPHNIMYYDVVEETTDS